MRRPGDIAPLPPGGRPIRALVIDDSALARRIISGILATDRGIEVVGTAADPYIAREKIKRLAPDVLTLDIEMPRMDGLTFLRNLMRLRPTPVVMVSTLTSAGAPATLEALSIGAVDFIAKPESDLAHGLADYATVLIEKVKAAAGAGLAIPMPMPAPAPGTGWEAFEEGHVLAIGASTGGTEAIRGVLSQLPGNAPPVLIAQHIPPAFSLAFAQRLDQHSALQVREVDAMCPLLPGHAYLAPGGRHLRVVRTGLQLHCRVDDDAPVRRHRPSVDVLFESLAAHAGARTSAALLTGMGDDGARGLLALRRAGAATIAQDRASSVVWGMPGTAVALGAAREIVPLALVAGRLLASASRQARHAS